MKCTSLPLHRREVITLIGGTAVTLFLHKIGRRFMCGWVRRETGGTRQSDLTPR